MSRGPKQMKIPSDLICKEGQMLTKDDKREPPKLAFLEFSTVELLRLSVNNNIEFWLP